MDGNVENGFSNPIYQSNEKQNTRYLLYPHYAYQGQSKKQFYLNFSFLIRTRSSCSIWLKRELSITTPNRFCLSLARSKNSCSFVISKAPIDFPGIFSTFPPSSCVAEICTIDSSLLLAPLSTVFVDGKSAYDGNTVGNEIVFFQGLLLPACVVFLTGG